MRRREGSILIEVIGTLLLIAVALPPLIEAMGTAVREQGREADYAQGMVYAARFMDAQRAKLFASIVSSAEAVIAGNTRFTQQVTVTTVNATLKQIDVTIRWNGGNDSYQVTTLKAG